MGKQVVISVGREFGSGGHEIAERLAKHYNIPLYDREIFQHVEEKSSISADVVRHFDERPVYPIFYPYAIEGNYYPLEQQVANQVFDFIRTKGEKEKESFVIVGRCAEYILRDNPALVSIFVLGDVDTKVKRIMDKYGLDEKTAYSRMKKEDKMRKTYHNFYSDSKWGDSRSYDICVNSSTLGIDKTIDTLITFIDGAMKG